MKLVSRSLIHYNAFYMRRSDALRLLLLSVIWGCSFLLMRLLAPVLGPALVVEVRVGLAAIFLFTLAIYLKKDKNPLTHWKHYLILGFFNSAFPFLLMTYSALTLPVSMLSVLNATTPTWGFLIGIVLRNEKFSPKRLLGVILGVVGVAVLLGSHAKDTAGFRSILVPVMTGIGAAFSYGIAANYAKKAKSVDPFLNAYGSMVAATLLIAPISWLMPIPQSIALSTIIYAVLIGVVCSGVAYLLFFRLIKDIGPTSATTVTFLVPIFGTLFSYLLLGESITLFSMLGMAIIVASTAFVTGIDFKALFSSKIV